ncbi:phosphoadenosine phosphosulfate reductase [Streptomyces scabiei]|uniref:phosphoadenosine phosphosulfate reductase n=1 Tax=Streptomyces scabiei TaxID=1930 RepID=UPI0029AC9A0E|nr:phosphoadenosine phosphosulfate reductase [Streptomyces scabiei]MDX2658277.1 phosphoadenosine phosphosulfate reductase [Streptomyces scabiei]MDX2870562.1 phosphoadenosine phosphosulfate reductase [Streptomyces scabiei]
MTSCAAIPDPTPIRSISYGGGVQSTALLVLAAQGRIDFRLFLMANVGDDSENPGTLRYIEEYARPFAADHGIELNVLDRIKRDGSVETLWGRLTREGSRSLPIPVRMSNGAPGQRSCTADFKIKVIGKELKRRGASEKTPAVIGIGISVDEIHRANNRKVEPHEVITYPLLDLGLRRTDCARIIREAGLPVPPKSSCFFCPFHRPETWHDQRRDEPELFEKSCQLEELLNARRDELGKDHVYLTRFNRPLRQAIPDGVDLLPMFDEADGACDSGWCMT